MATESVPVLTLYGRPGCHLCEEMKEALRRLQGRLRFDISVVDVDSDVELVRRYGAEVPVLAHEGRELARHRVDADAIADFLAGRR